MRKDKHFNVARQHPLKNTSSKIRFRWIVYISIFLIISMISYAVWEKHQKQSSVLQTHFSKFVLWFEQKKQLMQRNMNQVKKMTVSNVKERDDEPKIHFEFYKTLPNMQVALKSTDTLKVNHSLNEVELEDKSKIAYQKPIPSTINPFLNPEQLEKEFGKEIKSNKFIIQIASFRNLESAEEMRKAYLSIGLSVIIAKILLGNGPMYRVQMGPFDDKTKARLALRQLQRKGKYGILRKL